MHNLVKNYFVFIKLKTFNAYFIENFVVILCSFFKFTNKAIKLFILSYFDLMSNCTNQKRDSNSKDTPCLELGKNQHCPRYQFLENNFS
jgi:hypothetical protein